MKTNQKPQSPEVKIALMAGIFLAVAYAEFPIFAGFVNAVASKIFLGG